MGSTSTALKSGATTGYRPDIDGMRAVAVLAVLIFHAHLGFWSGGFTGVDVFFVLSGFLIGGHIIAEETSGTFTFAVFYTRRAKRILPTLFCVLAVSLLLGMFLFSPIERELLAKEGIATLLSASNLYYWHATGYFAVNADLRTLLMTWSLGVEEQFYLVAPILIVSLLRLKRSLSVALVLLTVLSFLLSMYQVVYHPNAAFYLLPGRAWELFSGVLLAYTLSRGGAGASRRMHEVFGVTGFLLVLLPILFLRSSSPFPGHSALPTVAGTTMLCFARGSWINRVCLSAQPLRYVGRISYSLYLWHWPLLVVARVVLGEDLPHGVALAMLALACVLAVASYHFIEQPFRKSEMPVWPLLLRYAAASALLICIFSGIAVTGGLRQLSPRLAQEESILTKINSQSCMVEDKTATPIVSATCFENTGRPALALWGDSHADSLSRELREKAHASGYDFINMEKGACPPLEDAGLYMTSYSQHGRECIAFNDDAVRLLAADKRVRVVVLTANWKDSFVAPQVEPNKGWLIERGGQENPLPSPEVTARMLSSHLNETIRILQASGKQVILLQDAPMFSIYPIWYMRMEYLPARRWMFGLVHPGVVADPGVYPPVRLEEDRHAREMISAAGESTGSQVFDLERGLCLPAGVCRYRMAKRLLYTDGQHLSLEGAKIALATFELAKAAPVQ